MDSGAGAKPEKSMSAKSISVGMSGVIIGSFISGATVAVLVLRSMQGDVETISTAALLGLLFVTGLAVAAIILAIVAISFSRTAERTITEKSEEINAVQAEMIARTLAVIERMESSALRFGDEIAGTIYDNFEMLAEEIHGTPLSRDVSGVEKESLADETGAIEQQADSVLEETAPVPVVEIIPEETPVKADEPPAAVPEPVMAKEEKPVTVEEQPVTVEEKPEVVATREKPVVVDPVADELRDTADRKYGEFKDIVLLGISNYPGVIARKIGEGQYRTHGDELADGVFVIQNDRVAVCTFCTNEIITERFMGESGDSFNVFLRSLVNELKSGHFTRVFLVFDGKLTNAGLYANALNGLSSKIDSETFACFELFEGSPDIVIPELTERVSQLMDAVCESPVEEDEVQALSFRRQIGA
jgi:outer membrane biosynthesis protein TonB